MFSLQAWQSLSKKQQTVVDKLTGREFSIKASKLWSAKDAEALETTKKGGDAGTEYVRLTDAQRLEFAQAARPTVDKALTKLQQEGIDGRAIYNDLQP